MIKKSVVLLISSFLVALTNQAIGSEIPESDAQTPTPKRHGSWQQAKIPHPTSSSALKLHWSNRLHFGGTAKLEASHQNNGVSADVTIREAKLTMDIRVHAWSQARLALLYEEAQKNTSGETETSIDSANITFGNTDSFPLYVTAGRMTLPFGNFSTQLIADPLTQQLAETKESIVQFGFASNGWKGSTYMFNGDAREVGEGGQLGQYGHGAHFGYEMETSFMSLGMGVSYTNAMENSETISAQIEQLDAMIDHIAGFGAYTMFATGPYTLTGEYLTALEKFASRELSWNGHGAQPSAWNLELGHAFYLLGKDAMLMASYQGTSEAQDLQLPENRFLGGISVVPVNNTKLSFEFYHDEGYITEEHPTGKNTDSATVQLAVSF